MVRHAGPPVGLAVTGLVDGVEKSRAVARAGPEAEGHGDQHERAGAEEHGGGRPATIEPATRSDTGARPKEASIDQAHHPTEHDGPRRWSQAMTTTLM